MRYPGENSAGRAPGRRQNPSGRSGSPDDRSAGSAASGQKATRGDASLFAPGYSSERSPAREPVPAGSGRYGAGGAAGKGPIRGFPPAPGQPAPVYPPGPFSAWNRAPAEADNGYDAAASDAWPAVGQLGPGAAGYADTGYAEPGQPAGSGQFPEAGAAESGYADPAYADPAYAGPGYADPGYADPGYSALAVSDPAADVTSTQSWDVVDNAAPASRWSDLGAEQRFPPSDGGQGAVPPGGAGPAGGAALTGPDLAPDAEGDGEGPPGPFDRAAPGPFDRGATGQGTRVTTGPNRGPATGPGQRAAAGSGPGRAPGARGRGTRGRTRPGGRSRHVRALLICGLALVVVIGAAVVWFARGGKSPSAATGSQRSNARPSAPDPSPTPSLGPWGHIATRAIDPVPLSLTELFPAQFTNAGISYAMTVDKAKTHCAPALVGSQLVAAVNAGGCTQAMRASYLSSNRKVMGTIGVLNLVTTTAAEKAGKAAGPTEFIAQLPAAHGLTRFLIKGTGIEAAEVKGHYLVLVWAELGTTHAPATAAQRTDLDDFISLLMQQTANVALANRMVTGSPAPSP
jgi:hypothetical protein